MNTTMRYIFALCLALLSAGALSSLSAQDARLAQQYFQNGEYEKAATTYLNLYQQNSNNDYFFDRYLECLIALQRYEEGEDAIRRQLRRNAENPTLYVMYGQLLERQYKNDEAKAQYAQAIEKLTPDQYSVTRLANAFVSLSKFDEAVATYERGMALLKDNRIFAFNLGELYRRTGESGKMVENYLNAIDDNPERVSQNHFPALFFRGRLPRAANPTLRPNSDKWRRHLLPRTLSLGVYTAQGLSQCPAPTQGHRYPL
jgi:tetratricopeptide (TPR) repeat protein